VKSLLLKLWFLPVIVSTIMMFAMYFAIQQTIRQSANDPQIELAEDGAAALESGTAPVALVGAVHVEIAKSLAPFVMIYDETGAPLASSGYLNGQVPVLPRGVLDYARANADDRITWQPASSTRIAAIVRHYGGANPGFIAAGRNMREVENRVDVIGFIILGAWGMIVAAIIILVVGIYRFTPSSV
jgi:hypothetical protein